MLMLMLMLQFILRFNAQLYMLKCIGMRLCFSSYSSVSPFHSFSPCMYVSTLICIEFKKGQAVSFGCIFEREMEVSEFGKTKLEMRMG